MALKGTAKIFKASATAFAVSMAQKVAEMIYDEFRRRRREKTNKVLESMIIEAFQDLNNKIKALHEDFKKLEESTKHEVQILRAELEKNPENKEMAFVWTLESMLKKNLQQLSQRIQTLEEDVQEWPETTKHELQLCRGYPENRENKEEEIARELVSMLNKKLRQVSQRIQTLEEKIKEWPETTKNELQLCRVYVEKNQGKKEEESSRALQCRMETLLQQLSQRFQTLEQALQLRQAFPYHEFQLFRAYLENNQVCIRGHVLRRIKTWKLLWTMSRFQGTLKILQWGSFSWHQEIVKEQLGYGGEGASLQQMGPVKSPAATAPPIVWQTREVSWREIHLLCSLSLLPCHQHGIFVLKNARLDFRSGWSSCW
ncbi:uncharacterized protein LOC135287876 isoform X3 [Passer domesticus]|uniref:uncharacterized protein LOC135287876 isoform X3 n=1 Tax=Passer domesticus TaxID=48849 RepID=UPI0030FEE95A